MGSDDIDDLLAFLDRRGARGAVADRRGAPEDAVDRLAALAPHPLPGLYRGFLREFGEDPAGMHLGHVPPIYTEPGWNLHTPEEIGIDSFQADRSPTHRYRTTPLGGLFTREEGGFYHDGRFPTLGDVVDHYDAHFGLGLDAEEREDLIQFLRSL